MMKRLSKAALLAAAAFMLAGIPACSGGDDGGSNEPPSVAVTDVTVNADKTTLYVSGDDTTATLTATVSPENATDKTVTWRSSNGTVATVSPETGSEVTVTVIAAGEATITVQAANDKTADVKLTVYADKASQEMFKTIAGTYKVGETSIGIDEIGFVTVNGERSEKPAVVDGTTLTIPGHSMTVADDKVATFDGQTAEKVKIALSKNGDAPEEYNTIKEALAAIPTTGTDTYTITLEPGTYSENGLSYNGSATIVIAGNTDTQFGKDVIIAGKGSSQTDSKSRCLLYVDGTANIVLKNVTLQNTLKRSDPDIPKDSKGNPLTQAEAFGFGSSGTVTAYNSSFLSHQDTVRTVGKAWFYQCYFEGDVDFLWMETSGQVALYEKCEIKMVGDEQNKAYVAAPGLAQSSPVGKGLVIYKSKVTVDDGVEGYLARTPWTDGKYNQVAYIDTTVDGTLKDVWYGAPIATAFAKTDIGWKLCPATAEKCEHTGDDVLSARMTAREYNGRYVILNRVFDTKTKQYKTAETQWDAAKALGIPGEDVSKNNIFLDYADVTKTSIGDELVVTDFSGTATGVTWSVKAFAKYENGELSEETDGVTIDSATGAITNNHSGNVYVEVTATKGSASDSIILFNVTATAIRLSQTEVSIAEGSDVTLTATFEPEGADAEVVWTSSDPSVATVDATGKVTAQSGHAGGTATITATIKDTDIKATCTVTVTQAVVLKKFGTSVAGADLQAYKGFGSNEVLVYDEPIVPGDGVSASITATITTRGKQVGVGFVSFRDGAYSDGTLDGMVFVTDQGVRYKKDHTSGWNGSWSGVKPMDDNANGATYVMTAKVEKTGLSVVVVDEAGKEYTYSNSNIGNFVSAMPLYLAVGGQSNNAGETLNVNTVAIQTTNGGGKVAELVDLAARTKVTYTTDVSKAVYTLAGSGKGQDAVIAKADLPALTDIVTLSVTNGTLEWDGDVTIKSSDWNNDTATIKATFTFLPTEKGQYAALFNKEVEIAVTDARTVDNNSGKISWFSDATTSISLAADNAASNNLVTGSNAVLLYKGTEAVTDEKLSANITARKTTGLAYKPGSYSFNANDIAITYELPFEVGNSDITLSDFSYSWACGATNNFYGSVSVFGNNELLKTTEKVQSTNGIGTSDAPTKVDLAVPVSANTNGKIVITIEASSDISNKSNDFVISETVLKFSKK